MSWPARGSVIVAENESDMTHEWMIDKHDLALLYDNAPASKRDILEQLGPLRSTFARFIDSEQTLAPLAQTELLALFDACSEADRSADELLPILRKLAPGNGQVGSRQVNQLIDHLRIRVMGFLSERGHQLDLVPHDHAFGSGGDFWKTGHATTGAAIVVAPLVTICKTGTTNVTSHHGSYQAMAEIGYDDSHLDSSRLNQQLTSYGYAFVSLASLGFPYSDVLKIARRRLWDEAMGTLQTQWQSCDHDWQTIVRTTDIPLDIFKIVSPNAQVLNPMHHSTGVCHLSMIPYVIGIYLHLGSSGIIVHSYDGIDEVANASSDCAENAANNLLIKVESERVIIAEFAPEALGLARARLREIEEEELLSDDVATLWRIINGAERGPKRDFVVANAAMLLLASRRLDAGEGDLVSQLRAEVGIAEQLIDSGRSYENFKQLLVAART